MLHPAVPRCIAKGMGCVLVGDPVQEVCPARRLARQALITLLMALALAGAALIGQFWPSRPAGPRPGCCTSSTGRTTACSRGRPAGSRVPQVHCHEYLNLLYTNASQAPGRPAPRRDHTVNRAHNHSQPKGLTR